MNIFEKEIMRRVKKCDCDAVYRERDNSVSVMYDGEKIAEIRDGKCEKTSDLTGEESEKFLQIRRLFGNISNYCAAYENGEPIKNPNLSDGFRLLFQIGKSEMAASYNRKSGFEFVVWNGDENPDFFVNYDDACEKFAVISGLVDGEKIFDDEELQSLYYCVFTTLEFNDALNEDMRNLLENLKRKLDIAIAKNLSAGEEKNYEN
ncbi:MAG: hypothetical protein K2N06_10720 [Oscillospiraceae bacterium]|nr:hypothetical protein [Oscillospiraceae bacterium]